jgi:hypothetical protein
MALDILVKKNMQTGEYYRVDDGSLNVKKPNNSKKTILEDVSDSFDCSVYKDGTVDIFASCIDAKLVHVRNFADKNSINVIMESSNKKSKIKNIRVLNINSSLHLFYCIDYSKRLLVHQVITDGDYSKEPEVIDQIGIRCVYDVTQDRMGNIHIVYAYDENTLNYRMYQNTLKTCTPPKTIVQGDVLSVSSYVHMDKLYLSYIQKDMDLKALYFACADDGGISKITSLLRGRSSCALFIKNEKFVIHWFENSMAFEALLDEKFKITRIKSLGRSTGIHRVKNHKSSYLCAFNLKREPFCDDVLSFEEEKREFKEKGYEATELLESYKNVLDAKRQELREDFITESLAKIELSLSNLVKLSEKICDSIKNTEYNVEKNLENGKDVKLSE